MPRSEFLFGGPAQAQARPTSPPASPPNQPATPPADAANSRNATLTALAGIGLLLLAMGVGVLIGRSGSTKQASAAPQVITVGGTASTGASTEGSFTSDWPAGTSGYTVQIETLPQSGTSVSAVAAAKAKATAKGATGVGALKSEEFSSLTAGEYVIYSGDYPKKAEAEKARTALAKSFPGATVIHVSSQGSSTEASETGKSTGSGKGVGETPSKPAPPSVLNNLRSSKGKSYEEKSKNLPDVVETG